MPGVPPNAGNILKRAFKGLFKRGKKDKQDESNSTRPAVQEQQQPTPVSETKPPQLPPVQNASPIQSFADESSKPLPLTQPLNTGEQKAHQETVPRNHIAQPGPPPTNNAFLTNTNATAADNVKKPETAAAGDVSPEETSPLAAPARSETEVSAIDNNDPLDPHPPATHAADAVDSTAPSATDLNNPLDTARKTDSAVDTSRPEEPPAPPPKENIQPNGPTPIDTTAASNGTAPLQLTAPEEKVALATEDAPPLKELKAAPGMSATSGPLEDFPEGGDMRFD